MQSTAKTPKQYIASLPLERQVQIKKLDAMIRKLAPSLKPYMQSGMLGYGKYQHKYASGREGEWMTIGLASQKNYISVYVCVADGKIYIAEQYKKYLPKASIGKSCVRFKNIDDISVPALLKMLKHAIRIVKANKNKLSS